MVPIALALMAPALASCRRRAGRRILFLVLVALLAICVLDGLDRRAGQLLHRPALAALPGPAGDGVETSPADARALRALERTLPRLIAARAPIFVANPRFDLVHAGDPLLYVILGHPNPTAYDVMQPGLVTTAAVQRQIIASLQRSRTGVVIRWLDPLADLIEPDGAGRSSGVHILDRYLAASYRPYATYGVYEVLVRSAPWTATSGASTTSTVAEQKR